MWYLWTLITAVMKIRCKVCRVSLRDQKILALISDGYLISSEIYSSDDCWDTVSLSLNDDTEGMISDADPGPGL
jgi:hypothetical protein